MGEGGNFADRGGPAGKGGIRETIVINQEQYLSLAEVQDLPIALLLLYIMNGSNSNVKLFISRIEANP